MYYLIISIGVIILSAVICHTIASVRHSKPVFWGVMGFLFGPLAIPFALFSKPVNKQQENRGC